VVLSAPDLDASIAPVTGSENLLQRVVKASAMFGKVPAILAFLLGDAGSAYGVGPLARLRLFRAFRRNNQRVETLSGIVEHLEIARALLAVPPSVPGDVVECGCYKGGCTVNLSLVCRLVGRRLIVCDSFAGLPPVLAHDRGHSTPHHGETGEYEEGQFAASLEEVRDTVAKFGAAEVCDWVVGYFDQSLADFDRPTVMAFLDVDLIDSLKPCLRAIWPRLAPPGRVYMHEAEDLTLVGVFFDQDWWQGEFKYRAPGFVGAGSGLPLVTLRGSDLGYAEKSATGA
jgi:O-methyltransferase